MIIIFFGGAEILAVIICIGILIAGFFSLYGAILEWLIANIWILILIVAVKALAEILIFRYKKNKQHLGDVSPYYGLIAATNITLGISFFMLIRSLASTQVEHPVLTFCCAVVGAFVLIGGAFLTMGPMFVSNKEDLTDVKKTNIAQMVFFALIMLLPLLSPNYKWLLVIVIGIAHFLWLWWQGGFE